MAVEGRGLSSRAALEGEQEMGTGESLSAPERVQRLRTALHAKAKGSPGIPVLFTVRQGVACRCSGRGLASGPP